MTTSLPPIDPGWANIISSLIAAAPGVLALYRTRSRPKTSRRRWRIRRWLLRILQRLFRWLARLFNRLARQCR